MTRTRVRFGRVVVLSVAAVLTVAPVARIARGSTHHQDPAPRVHIVQAGETLWAIARGTVGHEGDPRPLIERIRDANDLTAPTIVPGERLVIPAS